MHFELEDMVRTRMLLFLAIGLIVALAAAAACGGDDDEPAAGDATRTAATDGTDGADGHTAAPTDDGDGAGDGPSDVPEVDVCALLTHDDVVELMETESEPGGRRDDPPFFRCVYLTDAFLGVVIGVYPDDRQALEDYLERPVFGGEDAREIEGVGERAVWYEGNVALEVLQGDYIVTVEITATTTDALTRSTEMALRMLERLP
jgi:hypothetical protein